uniref:Uncharacterized protein n=1 Tax=Lepeophtheirus salmonis TaxID=72036 RepID=A0A0K2TAI3_LEPSM
MRKSTKSLKKRGQVCSSQRLVHVAHLSFRSQLLVS